MEKYESILSGAADRIISMAEQEQKHRHSMEQCRLSAQVNANQLAAREVRRGQWMSLFVVIVIAFLAGYAIYTDHAILSGVLGVGDLVWIVYLFINGKNGKAPK